MRDSMLPFNVQVSWHLFPPPNFLQPPRAVLGPPIILRLCPRNEHASGWPTSSALKHESKAIHGLTSLPWCWTAVAMPPRPASFNASSL